MTNVKPLMAFQVLWCGVTYWPPAAGELLPWAALFHLVFSVWAFSWAKWPQTADSPLASSIFGTYVRKVGECTWTQALLTTCLQNHVS